MNKLIELTITFPESETQTMILEKGSEAYKQMIDYAEINEGVTSEKPHVMKLDIEFIPTWKFNFKDLPIKINSRNVLITGSAEGYSANMQNNQHDKGEINLTFRDIEGIERVNIESFITEDMQEIGIEDIQFDQSNFSDWDEVGMQLQVEEKLKELLA